jgi:UDP-glucose 4-epimerase
LEQLFRNETEIAMKKKILVTGGAGYVGSICSETLVDAGHEVIVADNLQNGKREAVLAPARFFEMDLCDQAAVRDLFQEEAIDAVMHFAALADVTTSVKNPHQFFKNNVSGTLNLLEAMLEHGVKDLIFSSTAAVYGEPQSIPIDENHPKYPVNSYGESKLATERMLAWYASAYGFRCVSLRYFNAAGATARLGEDRSNESHLIPCLLDVALGKKSDVAIYGSNYSTRDGTCVRDYVHVVDIVAAHVLCLEHIGELRFEAFNVGHGVGYTVQEVLQEARQVTNCSIPARMVAPRPGDPAVLVATPAKLAARVGWRPSRSNLRDIIKDAWAWRLAHPKGYESTVVAATREIAAVGRNSSI